MTFYTVRPLSDRTQFQGPASGNRTPFKAPWAQTLQLLRKELDSIDASNVVLEVDVRERDIRADGALRADAKVQSSPGVRLAFDTPAGPTILATDRYGWDYSTPPKFYTDGWEFNVRAIALGLGALRQVHRYGIADRGEQYRGFRALESGSGVSPSGMTTDLALDIIARESGRLGGYVADNLADCVKLARANAHPDRNNGQQDRWRGVDEAVRVLQRNGRI